MNIRVTGKFDALFERYGNSDYIYDRRIRLKLREIIACYDECNVDEREFIYTIIDRFCEVIDLIEEKDEQYLDARLGVLEAADGGVECFMTSNNCIERLIPPCTAEQEFSDPVDPEMILGDFYYHFINTKSESTMKDYVARIRTFAYSPQYLSEMIESGVLGLKLYTEPINFIYENIEIILARFSTKDADGNTIKQRNNIRSALRLFNEFKRYHKR